MTAHYIDRTNEGSSQNKEQHLTNRILFGLRTLTDHRVKERSKTNKAFFALTLVVPRPPSIGAGLMTPCQRQQRGVVRYACVPDLELAE